LPFGRDAQNLIPFGMSMADTVDKVESGVDKVQKANPFDSEENRKSAWTKAEKMISKGKPEGALLALREVDSSGSHPTTLRLAGEATHKIAQRSNSKSDYRKAASLLRDSVSMNPKDKKSNASYNEVLNEMQDKGISESIIPRLINDGTPTVAGAFAFIASVILILAGLSILSQPKTYGDEVTFEMSWTNANGVKESGTITIELYAEEAPMHVENFKELVRGEHYDETIYHRIIQGFMLQGGDFTNSDGTGGHAVVWSGYCDGQIASSSSDCAETSWTLPDEADNGMVHEPYALSMAKTSSANTGGSQFFIVSPGSTPSHLDGVHTVFGKVIEGQDVVDKIDVVSTAGAQGSTPEYPVTLESATFGNDGGEPWYQFW
jgi:cyclophilin family peptidyl-prolyl cis-trans isomerase